MRAWAHAEWLGTGMLSDWGDLQTILQIARTGTLSGAARALGLSQPTMSRRLQAIEARLNRPVFLRRGDGRFEPSAEGRTLIAAAERMEAAFAAAGATLQASTRPIRVATCEAIAKMVIVPGLADWNGTTGGMAEVVVFDDLTDPPADAYDVLVTTRDFAPEAMIGRKLAILGWGLFAAAGHSATQGAARTTQDGLPVIRASGAFADVDVSIWFAAQGGEPMLASSSPLAQQEAAAAGLGIALLPVALAEADPRLRQVPYAPVPAVPTPSRDPRAPADRRWRTGRRRPSAQPWGTFVMMLCVCVIDTCANGAHTKA
jgi:DNA-binding transcriptional LysR family regulator